MGKKRTKREKNFPKHVVTGVAVTSLAFGVLTNAAGFENLFEPQSYKKFEKQLDKKSDYVSGKGKNTDLADQKNPNQKNSGNDLQQAMKLSGDQMKTSSQKIFRPARIPTIMLKMQILFLSQIPMVLEPLIQIPIPVIHLIQMEMIHRNQGHLTAIRSHPVTTHPIPMISRLHRIHQALMMIPKQLHGKKNS